MCTFGVEEWTGIVNDGRDVVNWADSLVVSLLPCCGLRRATSSCSSWFSNSRLAIRDCCSSLIWAFLLNISIFASIRPKVDSISCTSDYFQQSPVQVRSISFDACDTRPAYSEHGGVVGRAVTSHMYVKEGPGMAATLYTDQAIEREERDWEREERTCYRTVVVCWLLLLLFVDGCCCQNKNTIYIIHEG